MAGPPRVLLIGIAHFVSRKDIVRPEVLDMMTPEGQRQVRELVERLASYRPSKVIVELEYAEREQVNQRYAAYRSGQLELGPGEAEQVGFRLAAELGHDRVYPVNIMHRWWEPEIDDVAARDEKVGQIWAQLQEGFAAATERMNEQQRTTTLLERVIAGNTPEAQRRGLQEYLQCFSRLVDDQSYAGADMTGNWYHRNVRIYANILRVTEPDDRLFVLYGSGHITPLLHFFEASDEFTIDDPLEFLNG